MWGLAKLVLACFACIVYTSIGLVFHYFIKGDEIQYTASSIAIVFAWPFILFALFFLAGVALVIIIIIWTVISDKLHDRNMRKRYAKGTPAGNLREAVDDLLLDAAKSMHTESKPPRPKRD